MSSERGDGSATSSHCRARPEAAKAKANPRPDRATLVVAFGDAALCAALVASAARASVEVRLLKYERAAGHRQMVEKLRALYAALDPATLVVKLDG